MGWKLRVEDVARQKRLVRRRARGIQLEGKVEKVRRHQVLLGGACISNECDCEQNFGTYATCLRPELRDLQPRQWGKRKRVIPASLRKC